MGGIYGDVSPHLYGVTVTRSPVAALLVTAFAFSNGIASGKSVSVIVALWLLYSHTDAHFICTPKRRSGESHSARSCTQLAHMAPAKIATLRESLLQVRDARQSTVHGISYGESVDKK